MEQPCLLRRNRSWSDKPNTLTVSSTAPLQSTTQPFKAFHKPVNLELDSPPTTEEVVKAPQGNVHREGPRIGCNPCRCVQGWWPVLLDEIIHLFQPFLHKEQLPQEFRESTIVNIYKRKGNRHSCDNHRDISLLSISCKVLARVLLNRLLQHLGQGILPESQYGFRAGQGTVDMIFAARQLHKKCMEQHCDLYTTFVYLSKAFDTVSRDRLWKIMSKFGCPHKLITIVRQFHEGMQILVLDDDQPSESFTVSNVKQGCVLAPTLFSLMFSTMLTDAFRDRDAGVRIRHTPDGKLFNLKHVQAVTKVKETAIRDFGEDGLTISITISIKKY